jgi:hypothetical protein
MFRFGARNQYVGRDLEIEAPEFLVAGQMLCGDAVCAPGDQRKILLVRRRVEFVLRMSVNPGAVAPEYVHQEQFCRERGRWHIFVFELRDCVTQGGEERLVTGEW